MRISVANIGLEKYGSQDSIVKMEIIVRLIFSTTAFLISLQFGMSAIAAPVISGDYVSTFRVYCQPTLNLSHDPQGGTNSVTLAPSALTTYSVSLEHYNPQTGTLTSQGFSEKETSMLLHDSMTGLSGGPPSEVTDSLQFPYSNTDTTVTINGISYHAIYGRVNESGIVEYFVLLNIDQNGCMRQAEKMHR
jgi:hypothetical protein